MTLPCVTAADIGTDHGFVPIALLLEGRAEKCIAADINEGPLQRAREHIEAAGLSDRCEFRLGPGLSVLRENEAELVIIAGMGGMLIREILLSGKDKLSGVKQLVLSPHTDLPAVRSLLSELEFKIEDENVVLDEGKYYTVLSAFPGTSAPLTEEELFYGPVLIKKRPQVFLDLLRYRIQKEEEILRKIRLSEREDSVKAAAVHEKELRRLWCILEADTVS